MTIWRKPTPLTGAYNAIVCFPAPILEGSLPVTVTEPDALATPVPITRGVEATTSCTVSPGMKPVYVTVIFPPVNIGDVDNNARGKALMTANDGALDTLTAAVSTVVLVTGTVVVVTGTVVVVTGTVVAGASEIANDRETTEAAKYIPPPAWLATRVHVPEVNIVTWNPDTLHTDCVEEVRVTARVESEVAVTVKGDAEYSRSGSAPTVIIWVIRTN